MGFHLAATLIPLGSTMLAVAMPHVAASVGEPAARLTPLLVASYLFTCIVAQGPGGRLADRIGHLRAMGIGQATCAFGAILGATASGAPAVPMLVAARVLMALGGAIMLPAAMSLLRDVTPPEGRAHAFGAFSGVMGLAAAMGPILGGEVTQHLGWRATFLVQLLPVLVSAILLHLGARPAREIPAPPSDAPGSSGWSALLAVATRGPFVGGAAAVALLNCAMYAVLFELPVLLSGTLDSPAAVVGRVLLALTGAMIAGSWAGGRLCSRIGPRLTVVAASASASLGVALLSDPSRLAVATGAVPGLVLLGLGVGLTNGPAQASAMSLAPPGASATAAGLFSSLRYVGGAAGMLALLPLASAEGGELLALHQRALLLLLLAPLAAAGFALLLPGRRE
jgi:predicted MFS family arabinose efflux permease